MSKAICYFVGGIILLAGGAQVLAGDLGPVEENDGSVTRTMFDQVKPPSHTSSADKIHKRRATSTITEAFGWVYPHYTKAQFVGTCRSGGEASKTYDRGKKHAHVDKAAYGSFNANRTQDDPLILGTFSGNHIINFPSHFFKGSGTAPDHPDMEDAIRWTDNQYLNGDPDDDFQATFDHGVIEVATRSEVFVDGGTWTYVWTVINNQSVAYSFNWPSVRASDVNGWSGTVDANSQVSLTRTSSSIPGKNVGKIELKETGAQNPYWRFDSQTYYPSNLSHPDPVSNVSATVNGNTVTISWSLPATAVDRVYVYLDESTGVVAEGVADLSGSATSAVHETTNVGSLTYIVHTEKDWLPSEDRTVTVTK